MGEQAADEADQTEGAAALIAGRSMVDGRLVFPMPEGEAASGYVPVKLARRGRLWSWALQHHRPQAAGLEIIAAQTLVLGYVELEGELMVEGRLLIQDVSILQRGMELELTLVQENPGAVPPVYAYAFRPVNGSSSTAC